MAAAREERPEVAELIPDWLSYSSGEPQRGLTYMCQSQTLKQTRGGIKTNALASSLCALHLLLLAVLWSASKLAPDAHAQVGSTFLLFRQPVPDAVTVSIAIVDLLLLAIWLRAGSKQQQQFTTVTVAFSLTVATNLAFLATSNQFGLLPCPSPVVHDYVEGKDGKGYFLLVSEGCGFDSPHSHELVAVRVAANPVSYVVRSIGAFNRNGELDIGSRSTETTMSASKVLWERWKNGSPKLR